MKLQVWFDHRVIAEYPSNFAHMSRGMLNRNYAPHADKLQDIDEDDLLIFSQPVRHRDTEDDLRKLIVTTHKHTEWHVAGVGLTCGYLHADENCVNCGGKPQEDS